MPGTTSPTLVTPGSSTSRTKSGTWVRSGWGGEPGMKPLPLQMLGGGALSEGRQAQAFQGLSLDQCLSLSPEESPASLTTSSWLEASWMEPGTALAKAFKGFLTSRPLHQHSCNFLRGLQLHQDYCSHKDFSTWAGKSPCPVSLGNKLGLLVGVEGWTMVRTGRGLGGAKASPSGLASRGSWEGLSGVCMQRVTPEVRRRHGSKCSWRRR